MMHQKEIQESEVTGWCNVGKWEPTVSLRWFICHAHRALGRLAFLAFFKPPPFVTFYMSNPFTCLRLTEHLPSSQCVESFEWLYIPRGGQPFCCLYIFSWRSIFAGLSLPPQHPPPSTLSLSSSASLSPSLWPSTKEPLSLGYWLPWWHLTVFPPPPPHSQVLVQVGRETSRFSWLSTI